MSAAKAQREARRLRRRLHGRQILSPEQVDAIMRRIVDLTL